jgi:flagellar motor switch protein FliM
VQIETNIDHEKQETLKELKVLREQREKEHKAAQDRIKKLLESKDEI